MYRRKLNLKSYLESRHHIKFQALSFRWFQLWIDRVNLHRPTAVVSCACAMVRASPGPISVGAASTTQGRLDVSYAGRTELVLAMGGVKLNFSIS